MNAVIRMSEAEIVSGSNDSTIKIWIRKDDEFGLVQTISDHKESVNTLLKLNHEEMASGSADWTIKIWRKIGNQF